MAMGKLGGMGRGFGHLGAPLGRPAEPPPPPGTTGQPMGLLLALTYSS